MNFTPILFVIPSKVPLPLEHASIASKGSPTPVRTNPTIPNKYLSPSIFPSAGGKIKFPAPKNIENRAKPTTIESLVLFFICIPLSKE